jgi:hypothetical protein
VQYTRAYKRREEETYVNNSLDLPENSRNGLADERDGLEQTGLADEDIEQHLMDADKLFLPVSYIHLK